MRRCAEMAYLDERGGEQQARREGEAQQHVLGDRLVAIAVRHEARAAADAEALLSEEGSVKRGV